MKTFIKRLSLTMIALLLALPLAAFGQANYPTRYAFTALAGSPGSSGSANGTGSAARFDHPYGVAVDTNGIVYVADTFNNTIRKVTPAGAVTTMAAGFNHPVGVTADTSGNVYVADSDNHTIRKVTPAGVVTTLAGSAGISGTNNGTGSAARFNYPDALAVDSAGNIYVADTYNHTIRKVTPALVVTTLAGLAGSPGSANGIGSAARFYQPYGVAVDTNGNVYVSDTFNHTIRKVTPGGVVTTLAGLAGVTGSTDGAGSGARFNRPEGLGFDPNGNIFVAEYQNQTIRKVTPAGAVTTVADLTGNAARFTYPDGLAVDRAGNVYVADESNTIWKGSPAVRFTANPIGGVVPLVVQFTSPNTDTAGNAITNWNWSLGDGSTSTAQNPSHTFTSPGTFQPSLTVTNNKGVGIPGFGPVLNPRGLVANGGFESGSFAGWTLVGQTVGYNVVDTFNQSSEGMQPHAPSSYFARLGQMASLGSLSQTLATTPGAEYLISFWLNSPDGLTPNQFLVSWNGSQIYSANDLPAFGDNPAIAWSNLQFTVTATASATVLQFDFRDDPTALGLDDVSVVRISLALKIAASGNNVILSWPQTSSAYVLETSSDLSPGNWSPSGASVSVLEGQNEVTIPMGDGSQFFRLKKN